MRSNQVSRRSFIKGVGGLAVGLTGTYLSNLAFAQNASPSAANQETLVIIFLRGGWDALNVLPPISGEDYSIYALARPNIRIPLTGANAAINLDGQFGLHPAMSSLHSLYQAQKLAFIHAVGLTTDTRSHFDAQMFMELGTPGDKSANSGWLSRLINNTPNLPAFMPLPAMSVGGAQPLSLAGANNAITMYDPSSFALNGNWQYEMAQRAALRDLYSGTSWLEMAGTETLDMVDLIESANPGAYFPANGAVYPQGSLGDSFKTLAQIVKLQLGLRVATLDIGGWDTHRYQGDSGGGFLAGNLLAPLANCLGALYTDLDGSCGTNFINKLTIVVMSEFGRRLKENANHGTDHGHGCLQMVLGGSVKGGKIYGQWPGLQNDRLYEQADLAVTTDFRSVLSEIASHRLDIQDQTVLFPGFTNYTPLGFMENAYPHGTTPPGLTPHLFVPNIQSQAAPPACK